MWILYGTLLLVGILFDRLVVGQATHYQDLPACSDSVRSDCLTNHPGRVTQEVTTSAPGLELISGGESTSTEVDCGDGSHTVTLETYPGLWDLATGDQLAPPVPSTPVTCRFLGSKLEVLVAHPSGVALTATGVGPWWVDLAVVVLAIIGVFLLVPAAVLLPIFVPFTLLPALVFLPRDLPRWIRRVARVLAERRRRLDLPDDAEAAEAGVDGGGEPGGVGADAGEERRGDGVLPGKSEGVEAG